MSWIWGNLLGTIRLLIDDFVPEANYHALCAQSRLEMTNGKLISGKFTGKKEVGKSKKKIKYGKFSVNSNKILYVFALIFFNI